VGLVLLLGMAGLAFPVGGTVGGGGGPSAAHGDADDGLVTERRQRLSGGSRAGMTPEFARFGRRLVRRRRATLDAWIKQTGR
jgi:hypothetical protein